MSGQRATVILLGGSFNPAHRAHRRISLFARAALGTDAVWWLVSPGNVLKDPADNAPLAARYASAVRVARRAPIRVSAIEAELGTRYTLDTVRALVRRFPKQRFVWLMGADNLAQFHRWRGWRAIARALAIAVVARPGYDRNAMTGPAMAWLRRWRRRHGQHVTGASRSAPALYWLRIDPDPLSATALRAADPDWHRRRSVRSQRDMITHRRVGSAAR